MVVWVQVPSGVFGDSRVGSNPTRGIYGRFSIGAVFLYSARETESRFESDRGGDVRNIKSESW